MITKQFDTTVGTMVVDEGGCIHINPEWWRTLSAETQVEMVLHEANHFIVGLLSQVEKRPINRFQELVGLLQALPLEIPSRGEAQTLTMRRKALKSSNGKQK